MLCSARIGDDIKSMYRGSDHISLQVSAFERIFREIPRTALDQNEPCHSRGRHGRSTSVSGPAGPAAGTSGSRTAVLTTAAVWQVNLDKQTSLVTRRPLGYWPLVGR